MATNVIELRRFSEPDLKTLPQAVTIRDPDAIRPAAIALAREIGSLGLRIVLLPDLATMAPLLDPEGADLNEVVFGWEAAELAPWMARRLALQCPVLGACRVESEPYLVTDGVVRSLCPNPHLDFFTAGDFEGRTGLSAAIIIPVHLPFGQIGAAVLAGLEPPGSDLEQVFGRVDEELAPAVTRFVRTYVAATRDSRYMPNECRLSPRELDCLSWVAQGKTDLEIGIILGCSHAGVRYHITRASEKLGAVNRAQAAFRAGMLGHIGPNVL